MADLLAGFAQGMMEGMRDGENRKYRQMELDARLKSDQEQRARQSELDERSKKKDRFEASLSLRDKGFKAPQLGEGQDLYDLDPSQLEYDPQYLAMKRRQARAAVGGTGYEGKNLSAPDTLKVQEGDTIPNTLNDIEATLTNSQDMFGPFSGRVAALDPYNEKAQTVDAQLRTASQEFGRFMEGGVLRKEDEEKYRRMFPQLSDTPEVAKNKLAIVRKKMIDKQNANVAALKSQGYNTRGFATRQSPGLPGILTEKKPGLLPGGKMHDGMMSASPDPVAAKKARLEELRRKAAGQ